MFSTKSIATALLLGAAASVLTNAQDTAQSVEITTVGITTVTVYSSPPTSVATVVTFTADVSAPAPTVSEVSVVTAWTIAGSSIAIDPNSSTIPIISSTLYINVSAADNITTLATDTAAPTANLTSTTTFDPAAPISGHFGSASASSDGRSAPKATGSKNAAAADTSFLIRRSLKAMSVGFLLALAL
ncbi:hypothetical protein QBC44DRAFT_375062 [Cladorrhinum sp. PSN332]|nr:hypothetical protein QBC44DRAFT_375062 [Cladorrhinum sp. PSN332]